MRVSPYGGANDEINSWYDLSWREYGPASDAFGRVVERVLWRADDRFHPLALGLGLGGGVHLRVGDGGDGTMPEPVGPLVASEATEFDDVVLPAGYRKPAFLAPSVDVRRKDSQSHGGDRGSDGTSRATPSHHGHAFLIEWE